MTRRLAMSMCITTILASLGAGGCGGGGLDEGQPKDLTPGVPLDKAVMPLGTKGSNKPQKAEAPKSTNP